MPMQYIEIPPTEDNHEREHAYIEIAATDELGRPIPPALAAVGGDYNALLKDEVVAIAETRNVPAKGTKTEIIAALTANNPGTADKEN